MGAFGTFALARACSFIGNAMTTVALAFAVLEHSTPRDLGLVVAARIVPYLLLVIIGGSLADRFSRSTVMVLSQTGCGLTQAVVATTLITGNYHLGLLIPLLAGQGGLAAFTSPAARGALPELVTEDRLQKAVSTMAVINYSSRIVGPAIGAALVVTAGSGVALAVDAAGYLIAAALFAKLKLTGKPARTSMIDDLKEGWQVFRTTTWVWVTVAAFCVINAVHHGVWMVLGPAMAKATIGEFAWGLVISCTAIGVVLISLTCYRVKRIPLKIGQLAIVAAASQPLALGLGAGAKTLAAAAFISGVGLGLFAMAWETALQREIPNHLLSRVVAYDEFGSFVAIPIGQITAPLIAADIGNEATATGGAALYAIAALVPLLIPSVLAQRNAASEAERQRA